MKERYVLEAIQKAVTAAATPLSLPVKYVGLSMAVPASGKYLEIVHIPNNIENEFWNDSKTYQGIVRLVLHNKMDGKGVYESLDTMKQLSDYFTKGEKLTDPLNQVVVTITENPNIMGVLEEPPEILIPMTLRYSFFKA